jgi:dTDP-4-dehydrorhamnose 3,5-epimerase
MDFITLENKEKNRLVTDVLMHPLKVNKDASGVLVETLRTDWKEIYGPTREFAMQYYSITPSGVARDEDVWHYHEMQEDRFLVVSGEIVTVVADNRQDSPTNGLLNLFYMQAHIDPYILLIPKKTLHGFLVVSKSPAILLNFPTVLYNPKDEGRIRHSEMKVKFPDGDLFSWEKVRKEFPRVFTSS